jgi:hypothetical protein
MMLCVLRVMFPAPNLACKHGQVPFTGGEIRRNFSGK